jgi:hypothetical protein
LAGAEILATGLSGRFVVSVAAPQAEIIKLVPKAKSNLAKCLLIIKHLHTSFNASIGLNGQNKLYYGFSKN